MTEQEFRDVLKRSVANAGLSADRQIQVLARREGDEGKVRNWHKAKLIVVIALLLAMGVTGAVAGGWSMMDWNGKALQARQVESDRRMMELMDRQSTGQAVSVLKWNEEDLVYRGVLASGLDLHASSLEKLQAWVTDDGTLPWPVNIPEAYQMSRGTVHYVCGEDGSFRLRKQEVTEDGYIVSCFQIPTEHRFVGGYEIYLQDDKRQKLRIWLNLTQKQYMHGFPVEAGSTFTELNVDGMLRAIAIESGAETRVALRQEVPPMTYKVAKGLPDGVVNESLSEYDCLEIEIIGPGTAADLLAIFGLNAE